MTENEKSKMGRTVIEIDFDILEELCSIQCTNEEIVSVLKVSIDTVRRRVKENFGITFAVYYKQFSSKGLISLRRTQFHQAEDNVSMSIHLGKQYLGQSDKKDINLEGKLTLLDQMKSEEGEI